MASNAVISIDSAWSSISLEERLSLVVRCQAHGVKCALIVAAYSSAIAYGFDEIWLLSASLLIAFMTMPVAAAKTWRKEKPKLILQYLAVRSLSRRYAVGLNYSDISPVILFRGALADLDSESSNDTPTSKGTRSPQTIKPAVDPVNVWVCLLRSGLVVLREDTGGAKLEYYTPMSDQLRITDEEHSRKPGQIQVTIAGTGSAKKRKVCLTSDHQGDLYVFSKKAQRLIQEHAKLQERQQFVRKALTDDNLEMG